VEEIIELKKTLEFTFISDIEERQWQNMTMLLWYGRKKKQQRRTTREYDNATFASDSLNIGKKTQQRRTTREYDNATFTNDYVNSGTLIYREENPGKWIGEI